jgi:uncharacterized protein (DUF1778 family)
MNPEHREIIDRAAAYKGERVSSFMRRESLDAARMIIENGQQSAISDRKEAIQLIQNQNDGSGILQESECISS